MSNLTDFFPAAGGGGGGVLNEQTFITSGSFDPAAAGLEVGDKIIIFACGGGGGGVNASGATYEYQRGGAGGLVKQITVTLTATSAIPVTIGAGGTVGSNAGPAGNGGTTSVVGSGASISCNGGAGGSSSTSAAQLSTSNGPHWGATLNAEPTYNYAVGTATGAGGGINGFGVGGGCTAAEGSSGGTWGGASTNEGCGGRSGTGGTAGRSGIVKIYY